VITGASNMSNAMSGGKQAARKIDERLMPRNNRGEANSGVQRNRPLGAALSRIRIQPSGAGRAEPSRRHAASSLPAAAAPRSQQEVVTGLSPQEALEECRRCLRCDLRTAPGSRIDEEVA
jgi:hypothetical protein